MAALSDDQFRTDATVTFIGHLPCRDTTYHFSIDKNKNRKDKNNNATMSLVHMLTRSLILYIAIPGSPRRERSPLAHTCTVDSLLTNTCIRWTTR